MSEKVYSHKSLKEISAVRAFKKLVYQNSKYLSTQPSLRTYAISLVYKDIFKDVYCNICHSTNKLKQSENLTGKWLYKLLGYMHEILHILWKDWTMAIPVAVQGFQLRFWRTKVRYINVHIMSLFIEKWQKSLCVHVRVSPHMHLCKKHKRQHVL